MNTKITDAELIEHLKYDIEIDDDGVKMYYFNGKLYREDGPAIIYPSGIKQWYQNGELHREDGPALEHYSGVNMWYLDGINYIKEDFNEIIKRLTFRKKCHIICI